MSTKQLVDMDVYFRDPYSSKPTPGKLVTLQYLGKDEKIAYCYGKLLVTTSCTYYEFEDVDPSDVKYITGWSRKLHTLKDED